MLVSSRNTYSLFFFGSDYSVETLPYDNVMFHYHLTTKEFITIGAQRSIVMNSGLDWAATLTFIII
jgi:hypothetical protein